MKASRAVKTPGGRTPGGPQGGRTPGLGGLRPGPGPRPANRTAAPATPARSKVQVEVVKDPVEVFCRVRPDESEGHCIKVLDENTVQLCPPTTSRAFATGKETQCTFKHVFDTTAGQAEVFNRVGIPLVQDLVQGKNGLLFTYGVTGSGKTHTMQGSVKDGGVMAKAIDVIFNSVQELQTRKFQLRPDRMNGFEIQSDTDAAMERQQELVTNIKFPRRVGRGANTSGEDLANRVPDKQKVTVDEDMQFAVFVSYVEIYNNYTYDLLDSTKKDIVTGRQKLASKMLREDSYRNIYVHGAVEVECKSPEEALEAFYRGQKQRRVAETTLNMESSRSHSVFNIRVVSVPLDPVGEDIMADNSTLTVSQLALVDLAGSERTNRTGNTGTRLAEASKINQSLMTLRTCIEVLRENQNTGGDKAVPYRDSRITHLFRNYFEGDGKVKMVVCVNPRHGDFDENINVLKFAELTQEVQIERNVGVRFDLGLTPGRRRANQVFKEAVRRMEQEGQDVEGIVVDLAPVYSLGPEWPPLEMSRFDQEEIIVKLKSYLEKRIKTRKSLLDDQENKQRKFRDLLVGMDQEIVLLRAESKQLKHQLETERRRNSNLQTKLVNAEAANQSLSNKVAAYSDMKLIMENELDEKQLELNQEKIEKIKVKSKYRTKMVTEKKKLASELKNKFSAREEHIRQKEARSLAKLNAVMNLINDDGSDMTDINDENIENGAVTTSDTNLATVAHRRSTGRTPMKKRQQSNSPRRESVAVANPRAHRRSRSTDADVWLDHRPQVGGPVPSNTVLQPVLRNRRSLSKLETADVVNDKTSKYLLTTATQDQDGEVETRLYKADVIPTVGGGRQVVFNDVEVLTQESPEKEFEEAGRKRSYEEFKGIGARIADLQEKAGMSVQQPGTPREPRRKHSRV